MLLLSAPLTRYIRCHMMDFEKVEKSRCCDFCCYSWLCPLTSLCCRGMCFRRHKHAVAPIPVLFFGYIPAVLLYLFATVCRYMLNSDFLKYLWCFQSAGCTYQGVADKQAAMNKVFLNSKEWTLKAEFIFWWISLGLYYISGAECNRAAVKSNFPTWLCCSSWGHAQVEHDNCSCRRSQSLIIMGKGLGKNSYPNQHRPQRALVALLRVCPNGARYLGKCCITGRDGNLYGRRVVKHYVQWTL